MDYFTMKVTLLTNFLAASESLFTEVSSPAAITFNLEAAMLAFTKVFLIVVALALDNLSL